MRCGLTLSDMNASGSVRLAIAAVVVVALWGCALGSGEEPDDHLLDPNSTASTPDPCPLLTPEEIQQVQGGVIEVGREIRGNRNGERVCSYDQRDTKVLTSVSVYPDDRAGFDGEYEAVKQYDPDVAQAPGIGEAAFFSGVVLYALKGSFVVVVVASGPGDPGEAKAKLLALGPKAAARLP